MKVFFVLSLLLLYCLSCPVIAAVTCIQQFLKQYASDSIIYFDAGSYMISDTVTIPNNAVISQCSIFVARGFLIESRNPTWLYGTASEHAVFYQYEFFNAKKVVASMIQTESPYFQPTPNPPSPFKNAVGAMAGDPAYRCSAGETCDSSWALRIPNPSDIMIYGARLYSWFDTYTQGCLITSSRLEP
ncbi:uncharacterized protein P884DRAFT_272406 [Thermothelomyces heterothallicus CBS 202.75]|uniref:uncharacterized protein n=1 Tax=Thermothelomyces heterothallicus CBS 202.75 TaxID=1149848 RepID=UPI0037440E46